MTLRKRDTFSIGDTAKMSGATQKQIRNWEARGYILAPDRVVSGARAYRRFTPAEVDTIRKIREYLDEGFTLAAAAQKATGVNFTTKEGQRDA